MKIEMAAEAQTYLIPQELSSGEYSPAYPDFCIPPPELVGDLEGDNIDGSYFIVYDPDQHRLDGDFD